MAKITKLKKVNNINFANEIKREKWLYLMMLPGIAYYLIFKYGPMFGLVMVFQNYMPYLGFLKSPWVGFANFQRFFSEPIFSMLLRNTLVLALMNVLLYFPVPILFALLLNEVKNVRFKRLTQTFLYVPHFLSWVVIAAVSYTLFTVDNGVINDILTSIGRDKVPFLTTDTFFRPMILLQIIWKEAGWGTIIFLAVLTTIDPEQYNAAYIDGANRFQCLLHITLPSIKTTIVTLFIIRLGNFLDTGFEQLLLMNNSLTRSVGEVFDTYVYSLLITGGQFSYTAAVGFFKSFASLLLVITANQIAKRLGEEGIY